MPHHKYYEYFGLDYTLHVAPSNMENKNSCHLLEEIRSKLLENLSKLQHAPSVQFQERPPDSDHGEFMRLLIVIIGTMMAMFLVLTQPMDYTSQYPNQNQSQTSASFPDFVSTSVNRINPSVSHNLTCFLVGSGAVNRGVDQEAQNAASEPKHTLFHHRVTEESNNIRFSWLVYSVVSSDKDHLIKVTNHTLST
ncbi:hypothetical protein JHK82_015877 [Glycine max]|nr:hypothetical protein JHK82_015877 [Glycine max]